MRVLLALFVFGLVITAIGYYVYTTGMLGPKLPAGWTACTGTCTIPPNQEMRLYKSGDLTHNYQVVFPTGTGTGTGASIKFTCAKASFGAIDPKAPIGTLCAYKPANVSTGTGTGTGTFSVCADEGGTCTVPAGSQVRFFANTQPVQPFNNYTVAYPTGNTGSGTSTGTGTFSFFCALTSFPLDSAPGIKKICYYSPFTTAT
jgi:hypothetical protein